MARERGFEREARATAALRSPHTIAVYDYGVADDGTFHYVMELLEGFSLQDVVERFGPVPPERAVRMLRQACHSLAEAHAAGLVHRDVKPANLFVCRLGLDVDFVKVLDFGLVRMHGALAPGAEAVNADGGFTGTPGFMPPEVALAPPVVDGRADLYALGCVAYWLLTGQRVFEGERAMHMVIDHVRKAPVPPSQRAGQPIPEALERIILRCLEKDPARRPASAGELSRELQALEIEGRWTEERAREWWQARDVERRVIEAAEAFRVSPTARHAPCRPSTSRRCSSRAPRRRREPPELFSLSGRVLTAIGSPRLACPLHSEVRERFPMPVNGPRQRPIDEPNDLALRAAVEGVSAAFASLGRVFLCLDAGFEVVHASSLLDRLIGGAHLLPEQVHLRHELFLFHIGTACEEHECAS